MTQLKATATEKMPPRRYMTFVTVPCPILPAASYGPPIG